MGKNNKKGSRANVFKVAGAKSLKKTKSKAVNLGLKNIKQKVQDIDKEFLEMNNTTKANTTIPKDKGPKKQLNQKKTKPVTKEDVAKVAEAVVEMDL